MKHFSQGEVQEALAHAAAGGQGLHTHRTVADRGKAPLCFLREVEAGRDIAHLFDQDERRLVDTVRSLGVWRVFVERRGQPGQHVDLCGGPLRKALARAQAEAFENSGAEGGVNR